MFSRPLRVHWPSRRPRIAVAFLAVLVAGATLTLPAQTASAASTERIVNGRFDQGTTGWATGSSKHVLKVTHSGRSKSLGARIKTKNKKAVVLNDAKSTVASTTAGTKYTVTAYVRSSRAKVTAKLRVLEKNRAGNATYSAKRKLKKTSWYKLTLNFTAKRTGSTLDLQIRFTGTKSRQKLYVDDVSFLQVTTSTSGAGTSPTPTPGKGQTVSGECTRPALPAGTQFGSSVSMTSTIWLEDALADRDSRFGKIAAVRIWDEPMPFAWGADRLRSLAGRTLIMSFRPAPADVLSGKYDSQFRTWFQQAPESATIYWSYYHEPETPITEQGKFTADIYKRAWRHIKEIADSVCRQNMYSTLVLMEWTVNPSSGLSWKTYYPGDDVIDVLSFDPYNGVYDPTRDYYRSPSSLLDNIVATSKASGKPWGLAELGSRLIPSDPTGTKRAAWLTAIANYTRSNGAVFVTYFQSTRDGEWRLLDKPSMDAWRAAVASSPR